MRKSIFIASEVRSGSTYIAESFAYQWDKQFGYTLYNLANEMYTNINDLSSAEDILNIYNSTYLDKSGFTASKIMTAALSIITRESRLSNSVREAFFGETTFWIIVRRRDRIKQAASLALATKSGLFHYYENETKSPDDNCSIDRKDIQSALRAIELSDTYLDIFKQQLSTDHFIEIYYEDFVKDNATFINQFNQLIGFDAIPNSDDYKSLSKLLPTAKKLKLDESMDFKYWLLENNHPTIKQVEQVKQALTIPEDFSN